jgi:hypothetical protein
VRWAVSHARGVGKPGRLPTPTIESVGTYYKHGGAARTRATPG